MQLSPHIGVVPICNELVQTKCADVIYKNESGERQAKEGFRRDGKEKRGERGKMQPHARSIKRDH